MKRLYCLWIGILTLSTVLMAAERQPALPYFPDVEGYKTLVCDFHMHTVFSDGRVWPTVRVEEAWREGLDAIALSDHIEYQPHREDVSSNFERPYEIALPKAEELGVLLIKGAEITKDTPPGHYNAIFLKEIGPIHAPDVLDSVRAASEQKAFVFWNHHTWKGVELGQWDQVQTTMYKNKWLQGMEVANGANYYPLAHQWCLDRNLTMIGSSDLHGPFIDYVYTPQTHRTVTIVLARERSVEGIREALFDGRTLVWRNNQLVGRQAHLQAMFEASVSVSKVHHSRATRFFQITNQSFLDLELERVGKIGPVGLQIPARSTIQAKIAIGKDNGPQVLSYVVKNMQIAPEKGLPVQIKVAMSDISNKKTVESSK